MLLINAMVTPRVWSWPNPTKLTSGRHIYVQCVAHVLLRPKKLRALTKSCLEISLGTLVPNSRD